MRFTPRLGVPLVIGVIGLLMLVIVRGGEDPYTVKAVYADAGGLTENYDVKVDGVPAGRVKSVDLDDHDRAVLTLELDDGAAPIGAGAKAIARPVNLLGEKYVELQLGDRSRPQPSGSVIPQERTGAPVELDDALNTLDAGTRARLRILINEAGVALAGRGADFNALLRTMPKALDETRRVVAQVNTENAHLRRAISAGDRIIASVHDRRSDLEKLVTDVGETLDVVARRRADLGQTVAAAPGALREVTLALHELDGTAQALEPASRALRAAAPPLRDTLAALPDFTSQADETLARAVQVAPSLSKLGKQAAPDVRQITRTVKRLGTFAKDLAPLMRGLDRGVLRDAIGLMDGWSELIQRSDGLGHIFRVRFHLDQEIFMSALSRMGADAPPDPSGRKRRAKKQAPPASSAPAAPAPPATRERVPLPAIGEVLGKLKDTVDDAVRPLTDGLDKTLPKVLPGAPGAAGDRDMLRLLDYLLGS